LGVQRGGKNIFHENEEESVRKERKEAMRFLAEKSQPYRRGKKKKESVNEKLRHKKPRARKKKKRKKGVPAESHQKLTDLVNLFYNTTETDREKRGDA